MITITFGLDNSASRTVTETPTVAAALDSASLKADLGFGDNVEARIDGVTVPASTVLQDGDEVVLVTKASSKG